MRLESRTLLHISLALLPIGCATRGARAGPFPAAIADSVSTVRLSDAVTLYHLVQLAGPLRAAVLDIDLRQCVSIRAVKGAPTAVGRQTTTALLRSLPAADRALAAINADFFSFTPPGVPVGAMVEESRMLAGPIDRPVLAFDAEYRPFIGTLALQSTVVGTNTRIMASSWNRPRSGDTGIVDAAWGQPIDSLLMLTARRLVPLSAAPADSARYRVLPMQSTHSTPVFADTLLIFGPDIGPLRDGDTVTVTRTWAPITPYTAVGGFPLLLVDSAAAPNVNTAGAESFRGLNPRTAVGMARNSTRLLLVVIDGRRPTWSAGASTLQTAELLLALGAVSAVNLDGGGSSAMVVRTPSSGATRVVNRPSDAAGERAVANALAVLDRCSPSR